MSIRQDLQDYISDNGLSQSAVARAVGVTSPVVNQYLHGKYPGNVQEIERKIAAYLQKQREREAERKLEVDYVLTTTAKRVRDVLRLPTARCGTSSKRPTMPRRRRAGKSRCFNRVSRLKHFQAACR